VKLKFPENRELKKPSGRSFGRFALQSQCVAMISLFCVGTGNAFDRTGNSLEKTRNSPILLGAFGSTIPPALFLSKRRNRRRSVYDVALFARR
jgi:hypothetical protein